jgi:hypothetical protein
MSKGFTSFGISEDDFKEMISEILDSKLELVLNKILQENSNQKNDYQKDFLTREEVIKEFSVCSTKLYELKKACVLVPKNFAGGGRDYYFRKDLLKHFN